MELVAGTSTCDQHEYRLNRAKEKGEMSSSSQPSGSGSKWDQAAADQKTITIRGKNGEALAQKLAEAGVGQKISFAGDQSSQQGGSVKLYPSAVGQMTRFAKELDEANAEISGQSSTDSSSRR